jgi:hypothetical protein
MADHTGLVNMLGVSYAGLGSTRQRIAVPSPRPSDAASVPARGLGSRMPIRVPPPQPTAWPAYPVMVRSAELIGSIAPMGSSGASRTNPNLSGKYSITGTLTVTSAPAKRRVLLLHELYVAVWREAWSDPVTGAYTFTNLSPGPWSVIAYDYTGTYAGLINTGVIAS